MEGSPFAETPGIGPEIVNKSQNSKLTKKFKNEKSELLRYLCLNIYVFEWKPG